jgi:hypothetical protein
MSGGGGKSSSDIVREQRAEEDRRKSERRAAIQRLNALFGIEPEPGTVSTLPQFTIGGTGGGTWGGIDLSKYWQVPGESSLASQARSRKDVLEKLYSTIGDDVRAYHAQRLGEDLADTQREAKFELARRGHLGGSQELDVAGDVRKLNDRRLLEIGVLGDAAVSDARGRDQQARLGAIRDINADVDADSAIQGALSQVGLNTRAATEFGQGQNLGDAFAALTYLYGRRREAGQREAARQAYGGFGPSTGIAATGSRGAGTISQY